MQLPEAFISYLYLLKLYACSLEAYVFAQLLVEFGSEWN